MQTRISSCHRVRRLAAIDQAWYSKGNGWTFGAVLALEIRREAQCLWPGPNPTAACAEHAGNCHWGERWQIWCQDVGISAHQGWHCQRKGRCRLCERPTWRWRDGTQYPKYFDFKDSKFWITSSESFRFERAARVELRMFTWQQPHSGTLSLYRSSHLNRRTFWPAFSFESVWTQLERLPSKNKTTACHWDFNTHKVRQ